MIGAQRSTLGVSDRGTGPPEDDPLAVKRELDNQDSIGAQRMFEVLDAVNRGQSQLLPLISVLRYSGSSLISHISSYRRVWR